MEFDFPKIEHKILKFWRQNRTFEKSIKQRAGARDFVFYEGPPTANAKAGLHHVLARIYKDIICRYKTMQGLRVLRKAGWDTHGLPVELEIEKKLGLKNKKEIEKYGVAKFNKQCRKSVWLYKQDWEKLTERIGFWLDMKNPYITYKNDYIETLWWIIKQIWQKGLLYQGYKVVPYCPRCQTSLSSHEVALGYEKIKEPAIYLKFKVEKQPYGEFLTSSNPVKFKNTYLLVWTTTPWTLPGNAAVAVNPGFTYVKTKVRDEYLILAKERMKACGIEGQIIKEVKGKGLIGLKYQPLYPPTNPGPVGEKAYYVIGGDFVSLKEGTGLVHVAPAFGGEDLEAGKKHNLPILKTVTEEGKMKTPGYRWDGMFVKEADSLIIKDLRMRSLLFKKELYEHDYPFCWRCNSPLIYYPKEGWFINMQKVKRDLISNNQKINWIPAHLKKGRFGEWLRDLKDWTFSRERYWGTPLPIWKCKKCGFREIIGSKKDLFSQKFSKNRYYILRHGESLRNQRRIASSWPEKFHCPLTKNGENQIKKIARELKNRKVGIIFSSDLLRTRQTAEIVGKELGIKPKFDKRLREFNVGIFNGKSVDLVHEYFGKDLMARFKNMIPKGENYSLAKERMYKFLKEINGKYRNKNILIISHEAPLSLLEAAVRGIPNQKFFEFRRKSKLEVGKFKKLEFKDLPYNQEMELDFHRPFVDEVKFYCSRCDEKMERVPEVIDCWFDSGAMPFAQAHYPFENKELIDKKERFPADYISEAVDQTRGWFYTLLAVSTLLGLGAPYKNVISLGHVLDEKGEKMSKSKGNVVDPWYVVEKYGSDTLRWYFYTVNQPGDSKLFFERELEGTLKRFIMTLWNCYTFFDLYSLKKNSKLKIRSFPRENKFPPGHLKPQLKTKNLLDKWVISRLNEIIQVVTENLEKYDITSAARTVENFTIEDLSQWYIRRSRRRFQKPGSKGELKEVSDTLNYVLITLSKLTAPLIPLLSEEIYQAISNKRQATGSVHLEDWPEANKKLIRKELNQKMDLVRKIVSLGLRARAEAGIRVRQPLKKIKIKNVKLKINKEFMNLVKGELNVKEVTLNPKIKKEVELDIKITPKLREEGQIREVLRYIQGMRKVANYKPKDKILIRYSGSPALAETLSRNKDFILKETKAEDFVLGKKPKSVYNIEKEIKVDHQKLWLGIKKI